MDWYYSAEGQQNGPFTEEGLKDVIKMGLLRQTDYVWHDGMAEWVKLETIPEEFPAELFTVQILDRYDTSLTPEVAAVAVGAMTENGTGEAGAVASSTVAIPDHLHLKHSNLEELMKDYALPQIGTKGQVAKVVVPREAPKIDPIPPEERAELQKRLKWSAWTFYAIAGLGVINALIFLSGSKVGFCVGLGVSHTVTGIVGGLFGLILGMAICIGLGVAGFMASRGNFLAILGGMVFYLLDSFMLVSMGGLYGWLGFFLHLGLLGLLYLGLYASAKLSGILKFN